MTTPENPRKRLLKSQVIWDTKTDENGASSPSRRKKKGPPDPAGANCEATEAGRQGPAGPKSGLRHDIFERDARHEGVDRVPERLPVRVRLAQVHQPELDVGDAGYAVAAA